MRLLILIVFSLIGCVSLSLDEEAHRLALWNFSYVEDVDNEYLIYDSISIPFYGDCEDYAFTLQRVIGGDVWHIDREGKSAHAALVKNGIVYDSLFKHPINQSAYRGEFLFIMKATK